MSTMLQDTRHDETRDGTTADSDRPHEARSDVSSPTVVVGRRAPQVRRRVWVALLLAAVVAIGSLVALGSNNAATHADSTAAVLASDERDDAALAASVNGFGGADEAARSDALAPADELSVGATGAAGVPTTVPMSALEGRKVIRTGSIDMRAKDPGAVLNRATVIVETAGGYLAQQSASYENGADVSVTFRVPAAQFDATLRKLGGLGKIVSTQVGSSEVTAQVVDLEARIKSKRLAADRVRAMMATATKAADLIAIESELANREAEIESMQAQLNSVTDQVSLSTVAFHVSTTASAIIVEPDHRAGFAAGWNDGVDALGRGLATTANALGAVLPFLLLLGLPLLLALVIVRRRSAKRPTSSSPASSSPTAA